MKTVFELEGKSHADHIRVEQEFDTLTSTVLYSVEYGYHKVERLPFAEASLVLGQAILHSVQN